MLTKSISSVFRQLTPVARTTFSAGIVKRGNKGYSGASTPEGRLRGGALQAQNEAAIV